MSLLFFVGIAPIVGRTIEEAQARYESYLSNVDYVAGLVKFSGVSGIDMSKYPVDEPFVLSGDPTENATQGAINSMKGTVSDDKPWTPRRLGLKHAVSTVQTLLD